MKDLLFLPWWASAFADSGTAVGDVVGAETIVLTSSEFESFIVMVLPKESIFIYSVGESLSIRTQRQTYGKKQTNQAKHIESE